MVLHFYQPPTQELGITKLILNACYLPLLRLLSAKSGIGLTLNLSGSLLLQLQQLKATEFFDLVKKLLADQKIEIVNSAVYHPIIPLTPSAVVDRQILKNRQLLWDIFDVKTPAGFYPPELAVDADSLIRINSHYVIVDQTALDIKTSLARFDQKFLLVNNRPVCELLRSYPRELLVPMVVDLIQKNCPVGGLLVTASDAELFGHHYVERFQVLTDLLDLKDIKFITASQAVSQFETKSTGVAGVLPSTWQNCQNFDLWDKNDFQKNYLKLLKTGYDLTRGNLEDEAENYLDQSFSSCYLYWLSNWPWWHPDIVQDGADSLITSVRMASVPGIKKANMEIAYHDFLSKMWQYQWSGQVEENYRKYNQATDKFLGI